MDMEYTESTNDTEIALKVNEEFDVILAEARTAGFRWSLVKQAEPVCKLGQDEFQPAAGVGGSGKHRWHFRAAAVGAGEIELHYGRSWQEKTGPEKTFRMKVQVRP